MHVKLDGTPANVHDEKVLKAVEDSSAILLEKIEQKISSTTDPDMQQQGGEQKQTTRPQRSLSELIETKAFIKKITPLPKYDNPNSRWITPEEAAKLLSISERRLGNLRVKNESVNYNKCKICKYFTGENDSLKCADCTIEGDTGFLIFRSENGLIWCKSAQNSKNIFYLRSEVIKRKKINF